MVYKTIQNVKKKTVKELNIYTESLEDRIVTLENIIKALKIDSKQVQESLNTEGENLKKIVKLEKRINVIDKKVKNVGSVKTEKKEDQKSVCQRCEKLCENAQKLKEHMVEKHSLQIKCPETFYQTWKLEIHIKTI